MSVGRSAPYEQPEPLEEVSFVEIFLERPPGPDIAVPSKEKAAVDRIRQDLCAFIVGELYNMTCILPLR